MSRWSFRIFSSLCNNIIGSIYIFINILSLSQARRHAKMLRLQKKRTSKKTSIRAFVVRIQYVTSAILISIIPRAMEILLLIKVFHNEKMMPPRWHGKIETSLIRSLIKILKKIQNYSRIQGKCALGHEIEFQYERQSKTANYPCAHLTFRVIYKQ